jgi:hypothetical protein
LFHRTSSFKAHDFDPLLKFMNLESIIIETECSTEDLDDSFLETMASWLPNLHHLSLTNGWGSSRPSQCTLRGILHLVEHCPHLISMKIIFQASAEIGWNGRPGGGVVNENMEELEVGKSPITDPHAVASFLSNVCPNLTSIVAWDDDVDLDDPVEVESRRRWGETIQLFKGFVRNKRRYDREGKC